jgi:hypothetical protein
MTADQRRGSYILAAATIVLVGAMLEISVIVGTNRSSGT